MKKFMAVSIVLMGLTGCAAFSGSSTVAGKTLGSTCATAGAYYSSIAIGGTAADKTEALKLAAVLTPACEQTSPHAAVTAAMSEAFAKLAALAWGVK